MKKSELKPGMKLIMNNGYKYIVVGKDQYGDMIFSNEDTGGWMSGIGYGENLEKTNRNKEFFIEEIYMYDVLKKEWATVLPEYKVEEPTEIVNMSFKLNGESYVEICGNKTKVLFATDKNPEEIFTGTATCMEGDVYNKKKGIRIATYKALKEYVQNELDKMTK